MTTVQWFLVLDVRAEREGDFWILHIQGCGMTQVSDLSEVDATAADYVALMRGIPAERIKINLTGTYQNAAGSALGRTKTGPLGGGSDS